MITTTIWESLLPEHKQAILRHIQLHHHVPSACACGGPKEVLAYSERHIILNGIGQYRAMLLLCCQDCALITEHDAQQLGLP